MKFYFDNYENIVSNANLVDNVEMIDSDGISYTLDKNLDISNLDIDFGKKYFITIDEHKYNVEYRYIVKCERFEKEYRFSEQLGAIYSNEQTTFRIWAPTSHNVNLVDVSTNNVHKMERKENGVFEVNLSGDLHGFKYLFELEQTEKFKATDPYSYCTGPNMAYSVVVDFERLEQVSQLKERQLKDLTIYEIHVRDFSWNEYFNHKGKFLGLIETGVENKYGDSIGFDYVKSLGVSHIQLLPIYDFSSVKDDEENYNWGYDPAQYSCLKPLYGSDLSDDLAPINDFIKVVNTYHDAGIGVNMDVVYNHVHDSDKFILNKIVPHYYNRLNDDFTNSNGSFCGNDFESNTYMGRKFIVDSLVSLQKHFGFDGFRFDLMGIIDVETLNIAATELKKNNPNILLYGEGWDMPTNLENDQKGTMFNYNLLPDYAFFNDKFRDSVRGGMQDLNKLGIVGGNNLDKINDLINGSGFTRPSQSINYVSCHDNHTITDRLRINYSTDLESRVKLCYALVLLSSGIPFLHAGCEFMRSKKGVENSYISGYEINKINWDQVTENAVMVEFVKALISKRQENSYFNIDDYTALTHSLSLENFVINELKLDEDVIRHTINELSKAE